MQKSFFFLIYVLVLVACAPTKQVNSSAYSENLTAYLPDFSEEAQQVEERHKPPLSQTGTSDQPVGSIEQSLDKQYAIFTERNRGKASTFYSIQIYSGNSRSKANEARGRLISHFPNMRPYLQWQSPIYRVRVGRFYDRLDAYKTLKEIQKIFPLAKSFPEKVILSEEGVK